MNEFTHKEFPGGVLSLTGANSGAGLRRISRRVVVLRAQTGSMEVRMLEIALLFGALDTTERGDWARRVVRRYHAMFGESPIFNSWRHP